MRKARTCKRPCTICRKWFQPDPRQIGRQQTCGNPACQRELHRRPCREWNRKNRDYFKANYLSAKLEGTRDPPVSSKQDLAVSFNRRNKRYGHLFQNRYKSIICQEDVYLRELVRYIHLNPVRGGIISTLTELNEYGSVSYTHLTLPTN